MISVVYKNLRLLTQQRMASPFSYGTLGNMALDLQRFIYFRFIVEPHKL